MFDTIPQIDQDQMAADMHSASDGGRDVAWAYVSDGPAILAGPMKGQISFKSYKILFNGMPFVAAPNATDQIISQRAAAAIAIADYNRLILTPYFVAHPYGDPLHYAAYANPMIADLQAFVNARLVSMGLPKYYPG